MRHRATRGEGRLKSSCQGQRCAVESRGLEKESWVSGTWTWWWPRVPDILYETMTSSYVRFELVGQGIRKACNSICSY